MSGSCVVVKDAGRRGSDEKNWLEEQVMAAIKNLSRRPIERRGPLEVSDEIIEELSKRSFSK